MSDILRIQELVQNHFEETNHELFIEIVDTFVYEKGTTNSAVSEAITNFLKEMDIEDDYLEYIRIKDRKSYFKDFTLITLFDNIRLAMLNTSHNNARWYFKKIKEENDCKIKLLESTIRVKESEVKISEIKVDFLCGKLLYILENMNNNEMYFYGKEDDAKLVTLVKEYRDEDRANITTKKKRRNK